MNNRSLALLLIFIFLLSACTSSATPTAAPPEAPTAAPTNTQIVIPTVMPTAIVEQPTTAPTAYETITIKVNVSKLPSFAPAFIAEAEGYFGEFGIKIDPITFNKSTEAIPLLINGDLDVYQSFINSGLLNVLYQEKNIKVVADRGHIAPGDCTYLAILVRKDLYDSGAITSAKDLAGKTIVTSPAGTTGYLLSTYLAQVGLTTKDVVVNEIPTSAYIDAFANKSVDVILAPELYRTRLLQAGNAVELAKAEDIIGSTATSIVAFGKKLIVDQPDIGARFLAAYLKGVKQYNEGKTERNLQILADATGESKDMWNTACWTAINPDGLIDFKGVDAFQQWSIAQGQLDNAVTEEQFWNGEPLKAALNLLNP